MRLNSSFVRGLMIGKKVVDGKWLLQEDKLKALYIEEIPDSTARRFELRHSIIKVLYIFYRKLHHLQLDRKSVV